MVKEGYKEVRVGPKIVEIPMEWEIMNLNDLSKNKGQYGANESANEFDKNEFRYLRITDITEDGRLSNNDKKSIKKNDKNQKYLLEPGDIVFARTGSVGRTYLFKENDLKIPTVFAGYLIKFKLDKEITNYEYLFHYTHSFLYGSWVNSFSRSTTLANINAGEYRDLPVIYPPLPEQKKIASILSSVDKSIEKTDEVIEETKELKKGLMQELLTKGIGHSEFKEVRIGPKTIKIPNVWEVKSFDEVSSVNQGLQIAISKRSKKPGPNKLKYITVQHLNNPNDSRYIYYINEPRDSVICEKEDVLMTRTGNTGEVITDERGVFHNNFFKIDFDREILNKDYLFYYLNSKFIQHVIKTFAGTTTIPDLNHGDFYSIPVLIPTKKEQKKIASILSSVDAKIKKEKEYKDKLDRLKKGLMQKLLTGEIRVNTDMEV